MKWKGFVVGVTAFALVTTVGIASAIGKTKGRAKAPVPDEYSVTQTPQIAPEVYGPAVSAMPPSEKPLTGYSGGFFIQSKDEDFKFTFNGRVHFQYKYENTEGQQDKNTFLVRRAMLGFTGTIFKRFTVNTVIQGSTGSNFSYTDNTGAAATETRNINYWETSGDISIIPEFNVTFGDVYLPFDLQGETSSKSRFLIEQPLTAVQRDGLQPHTVARNPFGTDEDVGIKVYGNIWKFGYAAGAVNGAGPHQYNVNKKVNIGTRIWADVLEPMDGGEPDLAYSAKPRFVISAGTVLTDEDAVDPGTGSPISWTLDATGGVQFKWCGFALAAEAYFRRMKMGTASPYYLDDFGYYAQAGYFVWPKKFEIVGRGAQIFREGPENNSHEYGGGLNYYFKGYNAKIQLDYTRVLDFQNVVVNNPAAYTNHHRVRAMLSLNI